MRNDVVARCAWMLVLLGMWLVPAASSAQTAWRVSHTGGQSILVLNTPPLTGGQTYWFEIGGPNINNDLATGDSVATLRSSVGPVGTNIAGSDGCNTTSPRPPRSWWRGSCFSATIPTSYTTPTVFWVIVRSYSIASAATASVRVQRGTPISGGTTFVDTACSGSTIQTGCWTSLASNLSFGAAVSAIGTSATNYHFETRERPGTTSATYQMIAFAPSAASWDIRIGANSNHSNLVGSTAEFVGPLPSGITSSGVVFAGAWGGTSSPLDFVRNDRGTLPGGTTFGTDQDGDTLGNALESVLQTCDSPTTPSYCASLRGCSTTAPSCQSGETCGPLSTLCLASRRDSDQDGFEDALEFYGYQNGIDSLSNMGRFGANPAQYDIFAELDSANEDDAVIGASCRLSDDSYVDWYEARQMAEYYSTTTATAGGFYNANGAVGIALHVDIPAWFAGAVGGPPAADHPNYGVWGGASCITTPGCSSDADCTFGSVAGRCETANPGVRRRCAEFNQLAVYQTPQRRWLFRHMNVADGKPGVVGTVVGGGQAPNVYQAFTFSAVAVPHEIAHLARLDHSGPQYDAYTTHSDYNFSAVYASGLNYRYSYEGFFEVDTNYSQHPALGTQNDYRAVQQALSFSSLVGTANPVAMPETCVPFLGAAEHAALADSVRGMGLGHLGYPSVRSGSCVSVDWNRDGEYAPAGQTVAIHQAFREQNRDDHRTLRQTLGDTRWRRRYHPAEIVVTGSVRRIFRNEFDLSTATPRLRVSRSNSFVCPTLPQPAPYDRFPPCEFGATTSTDVGVGGTPIATNNFAACDITNPAASGDASLVVWQDLNVGTLRWGTLAPATTDQFDLTGAVAGSDARTVSDDSVLLGLARTPTGAVLVYRRSTGALVEQVLTWSGTVATWSAPTSLSTPMWAGMQGSAALTHVYGGSGFPDGAYMAASQPGPLIVVYRRTGSATWTQVGSVTGPADVLGQPVIEIGPAWNNPTPLRRMHIAAMLDDDWGTWVRDSDLGAPTFTETAMPNWARFDKDEPSIAATALATDMNGAAGVRAVDYDLAPPAFVPSGVCPVGTSATVVGPVTFCFQSGAPIVVAADGSIAGIGVINCAASGANATNGACPSGWSCADAPLGSFCGISDFLPMREQRAPFGDGLIQMRLERMNDWPQLRYGFCHTGRLLRAQSFTPTPYHYPISGLPGVDAEDVCVTAPTY